MGLLIMVIGIFNEHRLTFNHHILMVYYSLSIPITFPLLLLIKYSKKMGATTHKSIKNII